MVTDLEQVGLTAWPSSVAYGNALNFTLCYEAVRDLTPRTVITEVATSAEALSDLVRGEQLVAPLFVRSDQASAAKFAGIDACIAHDNSAESLRKPLEAIKSYVADAQSIMVKEMRNVDRTTELRMIGAHGQLLACDVEDEQTVDVRLRDCAATVFERLASVGADGEMIADVALEVTGQPLLIEWKPLLGATIHGTDALLRAFGNSVS